MADFYIVNDQIILERYGNKAKLIGHGIYGQVYSTDKKFAVKKYTFGEESNTIREVSILRYLDHPNIIKPLAFCKPYNIVERGFISHLYMNLATGTLNEIIKKKRDQPYPTAWYIYQILRALQYCHEQGFIHRDVKPSNILIFYDGLVQLADFGLAKAFYVYSETHTDVVCTICWRAPELLLGQQKYTHLIDIWSVGIIFFQFICPTVGVEYWEVNDQLALICKLLGQPTEAVWPEAVCLPNWYMIANHRDQPMLSSLVTNPKRLDLLRQLLAWEPQRVSAEIALKSAYFDHVRETINDKWRAVKNTQKRKRERSRFGLAYDWRQTLFSWLWELHNDFGFKSSTLFTTFDIIDNFTSHDIKITVGDLQGYGLACCALSIMLNEVYSVDWYQLADMSLNSYTVKELRTFAENVLITLDYNILYAPLSMFIKHAESEKEITLIVGLYLNFDWYQKWTRENFITVANEYMTGTISICLYPNDDECMRSDILEEYFYSLPQALANAIVQCEGEATSGDSRSERSGAASTL